MQNLERVTFANFKNKPLLSYAFAQEKTIKGKYYVRVPMIDEHLEELGAMYFTQTKNGLLGLNILTNLKKGVNSTGQVAFVDFINKKIQIGQYSNNQLMSIESIENTDFFNNLFREINVEKEIRGVCEEQTSIININGKDSLVIKNTSITPCGNQYDTFWARLKGWLISIGDFLSSGTSGSIDPQGINNSPFAVGYYSGWNLADFLGIDPLARSSIPSINMDPYYPGSGGTLNDGNNSQWGPYNSEQIEDEILLDATVQSVGYDDGASNNNGIDNSSFELFDTLKRPPTISDIMGEYNFVERLYSTENCFEISIKQIFKLGYRVGGWDPGGQTFQVFRRDTGPDKNVALKGVSYMIDALQKKIPIIVGVDYGGISPNTDSTTNHFVVIVGMGTTASGQIYFRFYDNMTSNPIYGANPLNLLFFNQSTGTLKGIFNGSSKRQTYKYQVSQIRKSFK